MPIKRFIQCLSGDLSKTATGKHYTAAKAKKAWAVLFNQHIQAHGLPETYTEYIIKMTRALELYSQAYTGKRWQIVKARVLEAEAANLLTARSERIELTCARISKFVGFPVRANECTVSEFYNYIAIMGTS